MPLTRAAPEPRRQPWSARQAVVGAVCVCAGALTAVPSVEPPSLRATPAPSPAPTSAPRRELPPPSGPVPNPPPPTRPKPHRRLRESTTALGQDTVPILPSPPAASGRQADDWATDYLPDSVVPMCSVEVRRVCIAQGELRMYLPPKTASSYRPPQYQSKKGTLVPARRDRSLGHLGLCNEGLPKGSADVQFRVEPSRASPPHPVRNSEALHLLHCWEYVGYHLWLCLLGAWLRLRRWGKSWTGGRFVALTATAGMGNTLAVGSAKGWEGSERRSQSRVKYLPSKYWPLWQVLASDPAAVWGLQDVDEGKCWRTAFLGSPNPYTAEPSEWTGFAADVRRALNLPTPTSGRSRCSPLRVTVVERQRFRMKNVHQVSEAVRDAAGEDAEVAVVQWERMPLREQLEKATQSSVLVATHGNGLTWAAMLPPGGAIVELWPGAPYNGNYARFARLGGLLHREVAHGTHPFRFDYEVNLVRLRAAVAEVSNHVRTGLCEGILPAATEAPASVSVWGDVVERVLAPRRHYYARFGLQKRHWRYHVGNVLGGDGGWEGLLNRAYLAANLQYTATPAAVDSSFAACKRNETLSSKERAECMCSHDIILHVRKHLPSFDLSERTWKVPAMRSQVEEAGRREREVDRQWEVEKALRAAGRWQRRLWRDSAAATALLSG